MNRKFLIAGAAFLGAVVTLALLLRRDTKVMNGKERSGTDSARSDKNTDGVGGTKPTPSANTDLRVQVHDHDGSEASNVQVAIVPDPARNAVPLATGVTASDGTVLLPFHLDGATTAVRVLACLYEEGVKLLWAEKSMFAAEVEQSRGKTVDLKFEEGSVIRGSFLEKDGTPSRKQEVYIRFGWAGGPSDPMSMVFGKLRPTTVLNRLRTVTDEHGAFSFRQVPDCITLSFFGGSTADGHSYEITTSLPSYKGTSHYQATPRGTYEVTIRRTPFPALSVHLRFPRGIMPSRATAAVRVERNAGDPNATTNTSVQVPQDGNVSIPIPLRQGSSVESLNGNRIWIAVYHPEVGMHFSTARLDTSNPRIEVEVVKADQAKDLEMVLKDSKGKSLPGFVLKLYTPIFRGRPIGEFTSDSSGRITILGLAHLPEDWKSSFHEMAREDHFYVSLETNKFSLKEGVGVNKQDSKPLPLGQLVELTIHEER